MKTETDKLVKKWAPIMDHKNIPSYAREKCAIALEDAEGRYSKDEKISDGIPEVVEVFSCILAVFSVMKENEVEKFKGVIHANDSAAMSLASDILKANKNLSYK